MIAEKSFCVAGGMTSQVKLVRIGRMITGVRISDDESAFAFWKRVVPRQPWFDEDREVAIAVMLDSKSNVKAWNLVSVGTDKNCIMTAKGVFRCAVACSASRVILMHNHPSGEYEPSKEDLHLTRDLLLAGQILGIRVEDHLIIGGKKYCSLRGEFPEMFGDHGDAVEAAAAELK
jgi:DNA repair protein RadC